MVIKDFILPGDDLTVLSELDNRELEIEISSNVYAKIEVLTLDNKVSISIKADYYENR